MENKFELVEKYNIDVDVFIEENGVTPVGKLPDNHLTKEFLRLYFTGQITKVWKRWLSDIYYAMTTKGEEISLPKTNLTAWDIEKIINDKRGGKRAGAGPKLKTGYVTTTLRIPSIYEYETFASQGTSEEQLSDVYTGRDKRIKAETESCSGRIAETIC